MSSALSQHVIEAAENERRKPQNGSDLDELSNTQLKQEVLRLRKLATKFLSSSRVTTAVFSAEGLCVTIGEFLCNCPRDAGQLSRLSVVCKATSANSASMYKSVCPYSLPSSVDPNPVLAWRAEAQLWAMLYLLPRLPRKKSIAVAGSFALHSYMRQERLEFAKKWAPNDVDVYLTEDSPLDSEQWKKGQNMLTFLKQILSFAKRVKENLGIQLTVKPLPDKFQPVKVYYPGDENPNHDSQCYSCGKNGHISKDCASHCTFCYLPGHDATDCSSVSFCRYCGSNDHRTRTCKKNRYYYYEPASLTLEKMQTYVEHVEHHRRAPNRQPPGYDESEAHIRLSIDQWSGSSFGILPRMEKYAEKEGGSSFFVVDLLLPPALAAVNMFTISFIGGRDWVTHTGFGMPTLEEAREKFRRDRFSCSGTEYLDYILGDADIDVCKLALQFETPRLRNVHSALEPLVQFEHTPKLTFKVADDIAASIRRQELQVLVSGHIKTPSRLRKYVTQRGFTVKGELGLKLMKMNNFKSAGVDKTMWKAKLAAIETALLIQPNNLTIHERYIRIIMEKGGWVSLKWTLSAMRTLHMMSSCLMLQQHNFEHPFALTKFKTAIEWFQTTNEYFDFRGPGGQHEKELYTEDGEASIRKVLEQATKVLEEKMFIGTSRDFCWKDVVPLLRMLGFVLAKKGEYSAALKLKYQVLDITKTGIVAASKEDKRFEVELLKTTMYDSVCVGLHMFQRGPTLTDYESGRNILDGALNFVIKQNFDQHIFENTLIAMLVKEIRGEIRTFDSVTGVANVAKEQGETKTGECKHTKGEVNHKTTTAMAGEGEGETFEEEREKGNEEDKSTTTTTTT